MQEIPKYQNIDDVYLHVFFGAGDEHYVVNATIPEIFSNSGTYRLVPPADYDVAYAFCTKDMFVKNGDTNAWMINTWRLEPISGIITVLDGSNPSSLIVTFRYYSSFVSIRCRDMSIEWPDVSANPDIYSQPLYPLQNKFPLKISFSIYHNELSLIKSYFRDAVRENRFILIVDDNSCAETFDTDTPSALRPGWAAEGPVFCDTIDLVNRDKVPWIDFRMIPHNYGDYYWFTALTPTSTWWPQETGGEWGWDYWKGNPNYSGDGVMTPTVGYAYPYEDWYDDYANALAYSGSGLNDLHISPNTDYTGPEYTKTYAVQIAVEGTPDQFMWTDDAWTHTYGPVSITVGDIDLNCGVKIYFDNTTGHEFGPPPDLWSWTENIKVPCMLPVLPIPPGGYIEWLSNIPEP